MIVITGPTATGKTNLAVNLASKINGEIISADSRQVYKNMNIGTGKDLDEYNINGLKINYHLIDIVEPGYEYNVFEFQNDFINSYNEIISKNKKPILCGGTGLYIESIIKGYRLINVPENIELRNDLEKQSKEELISILTSYKKIHNTTDITDINRLIRAIEIEKYNAENKAIKNDFPVINPIIFAIDLDREIIKNKIYKRLDFRLKNGMIEEVQMLLNSGVSADKLKFYGLEYKFVTQFILKEISYNELLNNLNIAIRQFAKRQMTWFRKMEKNGVIINWIDGLMTLDEKLSFICNKIN